MVYDITNLPGYQVQSDFMINLSVGLSLETSVKEFTDVDYKMCTKKNANDLEIVKEGLSSLRLALGHHTTLLVDIQTDTKSKTTVSKPT